MAKYFLKQTFHTLGEAFQNCLKRFPVTVCFIFALTGYLFLLVPPQDRLTDEKLIFIWGYYLSVGTLLSLSLHLWCEEMRKRSGRLITHTVGHLLLLADTLFLYTLSPEQSLTEISIAHAAGLLAVGMSPFFLSFMKEKNDIASWNFALSGITALVTSYIIGGIMSGGICLLAFSLHQLFDLQIGEEYYFYILIVCNIPLALMLFLGSLPKGAAKYDRRPLAKDFQVKTIHYLFLPLVTGYLIVLYAYAFQILIKWELPTGWVSWLVTVLMAGCIAIEFDLYPARMAGNRAWDNRIARYLPLLILPLLMLMTVGIARRLSDYGISVRRLYLITFNVWCYLVCIGLFITRVRRINWIPISFAGIFLLTSALPVNYASITRHLMRNDIRQALDMSGIRQLPLSQKQYEDWLKTMPAETAVSINGKLRYLDDMFGRESIGDLISEPVDIIDYDTVTVKEPAVTLEGHSDTGAKIIIPAGYRQFVAVENESFSYSSADSSAEHKAGKLPIPVSRWIEGSADTIYVSIKTLENLDKQPAQKALPAVWLECTSGRYRFILTSFFYNDYGDTAILTASGYLFMK